MVRGYFFCMKTTADAKHVIFVIISRNRLIKMIEKKCLVVVKMFLVEPVILKLNYDIYLCFRLRIDKRTNIFILIFYLLCYR